METAHTKNLPVGLSQLLLISFGLFLIALLIRFTYLSSYPPGFSQHGAYQFGLRARLLQGEFQTAGSLFELFERSRDYFLEETGPIAIPEAIFFKIFGVSVFTTRALPALLGSLTIPLAFLLGSLLWNIRAGLCGGLLLCFSSWHISISRYENCEHVVSPLQLIFTLLLLHWAWQKKSILLAICSGLVTGLSFYVYAANQTVPIMAALFTVVLWRRNRNAPVVAPSAGKMLALQASAFILTVIPYVVVAFDYGQYIPIRKRNLGEGPYRIASLSEAFSNLGSIGQQFFVQVSDPWFGFEGGAFLPLEALVIIFGSGVLAYRLARKQDAFLVFAMVGSILISMLPALLGPETPLRRLMLTATLLTLVGGLGLSSISIWVEKFAHGKKLASVVLFALLTGNCSWSVYRYFDNGAALEVKGNLRRRILAERLSSDLKSNLVKRYALTPPDNGLLEQLPLFLKFFTFELPPDRVAAFIESNPIMGLAVSDAETLPEISQPNSILFFKENYQAGADLLAVLRPKADFASRCREYDILFSDQALYACDLDAESK